MALDTWPATVPYIPRADSFARQEHHRPPRSFQPEGGPQLLRVQNSTLIKKMPYTILVNQTQYATLEEFLEITLKQATLNFLMPVPILSPVSYVTRRCYIEDGVWNDKPAESFSTIGGVDVRDTDVSFTLCAYRAAPT